MTDPLVERAADDFAAALVQWRGQRKLSQKQLAAQMGFDPSYVSHVEARRHRPTEDFARRAEAALAADGAIWQLFCDYDAARQAGAHPAAPAPAPATTPVAAPVGPGLSRTPVSPPQWFPAPSGLLVEHERSRLSFRDGAYHCTVSRDLYNAGPEPVTRYLVRIAVDRYPGEPDRSNRHYRDHPLTWTELNITARCGDEQMLWRPKLDRDAGKEVWLLFENGDARFPLYPGQRSRIEYSYTVGEDKWGHWFQRAVRLPTRRLSVELDFPADLRPVIWGVETSLTAEAGPLKSPVTQRREGDRVVFDWSVDAPALNARFRLEWRFRGALRATPNPPPDSAMRPSELMRRAGIVQLGAAMLERAVRWFELPDQAALATDIVARLLDALQRVGELHEFGKGIGLAAPQLGIGWAAAVVALPDREGAPTVLLNPRVVGESVEHDEQYEGCLSFFDVRGMVSRPLLIELEHEELSGARTTSTFTHAAARLVAHEVDHLGGLLYSDRMAPDAQLIPVEQYREQGQPWRYEQT